MDPENEIEAPFLEALELIHSCGKLQQALSLPIQPTTNHFHELFHPRPGGRRRCNDRVRTSGLAPVALNNFRFAQRASAFSSNGRNRLDQRIALRDVVAIRGSHDDRERDALRVDDEVRLAPVRRVRTGFFPPASCEPKNDRHWHIGKAR